MTRLQRSTPQHMTPPGSCSGLPCGQVILPLLVNTTVDCKWRDQHFILAKVVDRRPRFDKPEEYEYYVHYDRRAPLCCPCANSTRSACTGSVVPVPPLQHVRRSCLRSPRSTTSRCTTTGMRPCARLVRAEPGLLCLVGQSSCAHWQLCTLPGGCGAAQLRTCRCSPRPARRSAWCSL